MNRKNIGIAIVSLTIFLSGCDGMEDYYRDTHLVDIDGTEFMVRRLPGRDTSYHAVINQPDSTTVWTRDPSLSSRNVRAIEKHTGCQVIRETIENREVHTFAAVQC